MTFSVAELNRVHDYWAGSARQTIASTQENVRRQT